MNTVFLIAALSADGFISPTENEISTSWTSQSDKKRFRNLTKDAGVVIMGSRTYRTINRPLKDRLNIVYSRTQKFEGVETVSESPVVLIERLKKMGHTRIAVCGGSEIYSMFLRDGVIDELYLTIEPVLFGTGVRLLSDTFHQKLTLISSEQNEDGSIFTHYKTIRE